jgi:beta-hydroxylase
VIFHLISNPHKCLYPYNFYVEKVYGKKVFYTSAEKKNIFPSSSILERNWKKIRKEFYKLHIDTKNLWSNFTKENKEFWRGWNTIVLRSFGKDNRKNMELCPVLSKILKNDNNITTAIFSILEPGKTLHSHYGPFKGVLRYHLGVIVPPPTSGECYISVDGETYDWREGEGVLFDETYKHFATNNTDKTRVVLFLDVKRPNLPIINDILLYLIGISPYNL